MDLKLGIELPNMLWLHSEHMYVVRSIFIFMKVEIHGSWIHGCFYMLIKETNNTLSLILNLYQNFIGEQDAVFCGVFDGHGPSGHKVSQYVRDVFPTKLSESFKHPRFKTRNVDEDSKSENTDDPVDDNHGLLYSLVKASLVESFKDMDESLEANGRIESYCSGTTAVTVLKKVHVFFLIWILIVRVITLSLV